MFDTLIRKGKWTQEEEELLLKLVEEDLENKAKIPTDTSEAYGCQLIDGISWVRISEKMGGKRNTQQCLVKWYGSGKRSKGIRDRLGRPLLWHQCIGLALASLAFILGLKLGVCCMQATLLGGTRTKTSI